MQIWNILAENGLQCKCGCVLPHSKNSVTCCILLCFFFVWILQISQRVCHHLSFIRKFSVVLILVSTVGPFPDNVVDVVCRLQKFG